MTCHMSSVLRPDMFGLFFSKWKCHGRGKYPIQAGTKTWGQGKGLSFFASAIISTQNTSICPGKEPHAWTLKNEQG